MKLKEENEDIKIKLGDISIQNDMKKEMRKSYIEKLEQINTLYSDIKENMTNIKEYYIDEEPIIKIDKFAMFIFFKYLIISALILLTIFFSYFI